jgi:prepilin-type N-terminal cleavage/methylation domain-containing protein
MIGTIRKPAFTLLEVIVAVAIFAVIVLASAQIFQAVVSSQVTGFSETALQDDIRYSLEFFTRGARAAQRNTTTGTVCGVPAGYTYYYGDDSALYFKSASGSCLIYYGQVDANGINRLMLSRDGAVFPVSSDKLNIQNLKFIVVDSSTVQPLVTINFTVESNINPNLPALDIQASVNSNWYAN